MKPDLLTSSKLIASLPDAMSFVSRMSIEQRCTLFLFSIVASHVVALIWIILSD